MFIGKDGQVYDDVNFEKDLDRYIVKIRRDFYAADDSEAYLENLYEAHKLNPNSTREDILIITALMVLGTREVVVIGVDGGLF